MQTRQTDRDENFVSETRFLFDLGQREFLDALREVSLIDDADARKLRYLLDSDQTDLSVMQLMLNLGMVSESDLLNFFSASLGLRILESLRGAARSARSCAPSPAGFPGSSSTSRSRRCAQY